MNVVGLLNIMQFGKSKIDNVFLIFYMIYNITIHCCMVFKVGIIILSPITQIDKDR